MYFRPSFLYICSLTKTNKVMTNQIKLGQVYKFLGDDVFSEDNKYFILTLNGGKKPNYVMLKKLNPQTMIDDLKWKFRKCWGAAEKVVDPQNITQEEFDNICGFQRKDGFALVDPSEFESIKAKYADLTLVSEKKLPDDFPKKWGDDFRFLTKSEIELYILVKQKLFPKYRSMSLIHFPYKQIYYLEVGDGPFGAVARVEDRKSTRLNSSHT